MRSQLWGVYPQHPATPTSGFCAPVAARLNVNLEQDVEFCPGSRKSQDANLAGMPDLSDVVALNVVNVPSTLAAWEVGGRKAYRRGGGSE